MSKSVPTPRVPCAEDDTPIGGIMPNLINDLLELVDALPGIIVVGSLVFSAEMAPLEPIHGSKIPLATMGETDFIEIRATSVSLPDIHSFL